MQHSRIGHYAAKCASGRYKTSKNFLIEYICQQINMDPLDFSPQLQHILSNEKLSAREQALTGFRLNKTTDGPLVGAAGELIAEAYFEKLRVANLISSFKYTGDQPGHDFAICINGQTITIDVKTKRRTKAPEEYFEMSVPAYLCEHPEYVDPDFFLCIQVNCTMIDPRKFTKGWVIGSISKANYLAKRKLVPKGSKVGGSGGVQGEMPTDVFNVLFKDLKSPLCV